MNMKKPISPNSNTFKAGFTFAKFLVIILRIIRLLVTIFLVAIMFEILAHFVPELKEQIPSFYKIVDFILHLFEVFFSWFASKLKIF